MVNLHSWHLLSLVFLGHRGCDSRGPLVHIQPGPPGRVIARHHSVRTKQVLELLEAFLTGFAPHKLAMLCCEKPERLCHVRVGPASLRLHKHLAESSCLEERLYSKLVLRSIPGLNSLNLFRISTHPLFVKDVTKPLDLLLSQLTLLPPQGDVELLQSGQKSFQPLIMLPALPMHNNIILDLNYSFKTLQNPPQFFMTFRTATSHSLDQRVEPIQTVRTIEFKKIL